LASEYAAAGARLHIVAMDRLTTSGGLLRWARYLLRWPLTVARITRLARSLDADVVHTNSLHSWYGWAAAAILRRAHVWHAREVVFQSRAALRAERWLTRHWADRVIAISEVVAHQLRGAPVVVVTDEADPDRFDPGRAGRFRVEEGIADSALVVGSVARLDTWKGFGTLLDGFAILVRERPGVELVLVGAEVPGKEEYAAAIRERALRTPGARWMGARNDVGDVMADLDVFVQVSSEPEPFGLVIVEALASGVPVVAGDEGGPLEILGKEAASHALPAGRLVPPDDAAALASAVAELLPPVTSAQGRASRVPLRHPAPAHWGEIVDEVVRARRAY
jgi:glycosyltransferase involved in cell wall biosynthesis